MTQSAEEDGFAHAGEAAAEALAAEIDALMGPDTPSIRLIRRQRSRAWKGEPAAFVLATAHALATRRNRRRWVAYELIRFHPGAFERIDDARLARLAVGLDSWDSVDAFGRILSGPAWARGRASDALIAAWADSPDRWLRRAALVSTVALNHPADGGDVDAPHMAICARLAADRDDMVVKAVSWALRELAARDAAAVAAFVAGQGPNLAARVRREVATKLRTGRKRATSAAKRVRPLPNLIPIDDPADPRIEAYRAVRERDLAGRRQGFIAEGEVVLRVLARRGLHRTVSVLVAANRVERQGELIAEFGGDIPVLVAGLAVMDQIVGFHIHRGLLAFGERASPRSADALLGAIDGPGIVVALFGLSNHDNVGGVFRNAAAFGAKAVLLDRACCDPLYRKAIRVSVGASLAVPFARFGPGENAIELLSRHGFEALALSPAGATPLGAVAPPARSALLLGTEGQGLGSDLLAAARTVAIPMRSDFDSLNVAVASGVALHHLTSVSARFGRSAPSG